MAPLEALQLNVGLVDTSLALFVGDASVGTDGGFGNDEDVVKLEMVHPLDPPELIA